MRKGRPGRWLVSLAVLVAVAVSLGGGTTFVALEITTDPKFCTSCHIMEPYYESWASSSHSFVSCVDCHYEPGLLETFEGKFKALSQLAKYVTATEGSKPWAEVSDHSCMRSGCHSSRLLEGEIRFGRIRFDHRHHLVGLRREKKLRCTSCHSQIVQGDHLTVTTSTCFLCHFKSDGGTEPIDDCDLCHGPPSDSIALGDLTFRHGEYLDRGVTCDACHGDVVRGTGSVPTERCGSCHNRQEHLERIGEVEFMHRNHVTDHSVTCLDCHTEIEHGLPPREEHYAGACTDCHAGSHGVPSGIYRGTGGSGVADAPSVMYEARVTCTGCHRPPFPGAPVPPAGATFAADPLACLDCHGPGFEGMVERWQAETRTAVAGVRASLEDLHARLAADEEWPADDRAAAEGRHDAAAANLGLVLLDRSDGAHNLPYVRALLRQAAADAAAGQRALDPAARPRPVAVGPRVDTPEGCANLCHVGVEEIAVGPVAGRDFPHARHVLGVAAGCTVCHAAEPHGVTDVGPQDCMSCHHADEDPDTCAACHADVVELRGQRIEGDPPPMEDFDCLTCHADLEQGHGVETLKANCDFCHEDVEPGFSSRRFDPWVAEARAGLQALSARLQAPPPGDAGGSAAEAAAEVAAEVRRLLDAGPAHNGPFSRAAAVRLAARLDAAEGKPPSGEDGHELPRYPSIEEADP